jgi:creatinine amidohydrolase
MGCQKTLYEELLPEEFVERINAFPVAYLPLGTLEWHGLHLPLGADGLQARGVFQRIAADAGGIVLPMLFLGPDREVERDGKVYYGMDFLSFDESDPQQLEGSAYHMPEGQFAALLDTIVRDLARAGFKVVVGHGHGPSTDAFAGRAGAFLERFGVRAYTLHDLGCSGDEGIQTDHAAANETSLVMALRPDLVDLGRLAPDDAPVSVWGEDPRTAASAARGAELVDKNRDLAVGKLKSIVAGFPPARRRIDYRAAKNLLR